MSEYSHLDVKGARILHTIAHPVCFNIVDCLSAGPRRMVDISGAVKMENGPNLWRYVKRMVETGVVVKHRKSKEVRYGLANDDMVSFVEACRKVAQNS